MTQRFRALIVTSAMLAIQYVYQYCLTLYCINLSLILSLLRQLTLKDRQKNKKGYPMF